MRGVTVTLQAFLKRQHRRTVAFRIQQREAIPTAQDRPPVAADRTVDTAVPAPLRTASIKFA